jgi:hypothetical protein
MIPRNLKQKLQHMKCLLFPLSFYLVFVALGCSGCGGAKEATTEISQNSTASPSSNPKIPNLTSWQLDSIQKDALNKLPITINNGDWNSQIVDEFNVKKQILRFKDPKTDRVIKTVDVVEENPFHQLGFNRRIEPGSPNDTYFLMKKGTEKKHELQQFLPKEIFDEIPDDFIFYRAIAEVNVRTTDSKYATINYKLDWLPDAYYDNGEWNGPGYGSHFIVVFDSLGHKIFSQQFGGISDGFSVSEDGKYLFNMICLSPEWDENIRYKFMVINIKTNKIVYEELIENCKLNGGGGDFNNYKSITCNASSITKKNNSLKSYLYYNGAFYIQKEYQFIDNWFILPNQQLKIYYLNRPMEIIDFNSFFNEIKLD